MYHKNAEQGTRRSARIEEQRKKQDIKKAHEKSAKTLYKILHPSTEEQIEEILESQRVVQYYIDHERDSRSSLLFYIQQFHSNLAQLELDVRFLKTDLLEQLKQVRRTVHQFNLEGTGNALNFPSINQHLTALDKHSISHGDSFRQLNETLSGIRSEIRVLNQGVGHLAVRVGNLEQTYSKKRPVDLTESDTKKRSKVDKNLDE